MSVNTNKAGLLALQALNANARDVQDTQNRIATGLRIATAKDNGAIWSIAKGMSVENGALGVVGDSLARARSALDVASNGADNVQDLIDRIQDKALAYQDRSLNTASRANLRNDITQLVGQINKVVGGASFDGMNLINGDYTTGVVRRAATNSYALPTSIDTPQSFSTVMEELSGIAGSSQSRAATTRFVLPYSPLTPDSFSQPMLATAGGTSAMGDRLVSGSGSGAATLITPFQDSQGNYIGPYASAGQVNVAVDAYTDADTFEIWQGGQRVAASGQPYVAGAGAVAAGSAVSGQNVLSFDYDPTKGPVELRTTSATAWAVDAMNTGASLSPPSSHALTLSSQPTIDPPPPVLLDPETSGGVSPSASSTTKVVDGGTNPGRVDLVFDAFDTPDTLEIWQNGVRVAATGQPYASGGGAVGAASAVTGANVVSFDYDPANGQTLEFRFNETYAETGGWAVGGPVLQPLTAPALTANVTVSTSATKTIQSYEDPYDPSVSTPGLTPETLYDGDGVASYTLDAGPKAGRVDMLFDAFDLPDTVEVWQNGVRIAASGQAYASGGGAVGAATGVTGTNVISFDYDPANGQDLEFRFNNDPATPGSAWTVGALAFQPTSAPLPAATSSASQFDYTGPIFVEYAPLVSTAGDTLKLKTRNLTSAYLGFDAIDWNDPAGLLAITKGAMDKALEAATYLGERQNAIDGLQTMFDQLRDSLTSGVGNLVDADLAKESAKLQSAQARVQLSTQTLAIANAAPQWMLRLFNLGG